VARTAWWTGSPPFPSFPFTHEDRFSFFSCSVSGTVEEFFSTDDEREIMGGALHLSRQITTLSGVFSFCSLISFFSSFSRLVSKKVPVILTRLPVICLIDPMICTENSPRFSAESNSLLPRSRRRLVHPVIPLFPGIE